MEDAKKDLDTKTNDHTAKDTTHKEKVTGYNEAVQAYHNGYIGRFFKKVAAGEG